MCGDQRHMRRWAGTQMMYVHAAGGDDHPLTQYLTYPSRSLSEPSFVTQNCPNLHVATATKCLQQFASKECWQEAIEKLV